MGAFYEFIPDESVRLIGCEAAGRGIHTAETAATIATGTMGVFHGMKSYFCQDEYGQIAPVYSISAGLDYPGIGPEHAHLYDTKRAEYVPITDDEAVEAFEYLSRIEGIENKENLGGSGGFNTGLRIVRDKGYSYFMCLDDDAAVDENALSVLYHYMEEHTDTGMAGCRVYHTQMSDYIQQSGLLIDFDNCTAKTIGADMPEDGSLPDVIECDTVATCAVMVRADTVKQKGVGIMPEDNFIYWDDMEWGYRIKLAGYRVVTLAEAKALHQMGANTKKENTFINYYMWRNRTNFFMRFTPEAQMEAMSVKVLGAVFDAMYESMFREEHNIRQTISYAFYDALAGVRGKADSYKIMKNDANDNKLIQTLQGRKSFAIEENNQEEDAYYLRNFIASVCPDLREEEQTKAEIVFRFCDYIFYSEKMPDGKEILIDSERNCVVDENDIEICKNYGYSKWLFIYMNQGVFLAAARRMRGEIVDE